MSLVLQNPLSNSPHQIKFYISNTTQFNPTKTPKFPIIHNPFQPLQFNKYPFHKTLILSPIKAYNSPLASEHETIPSKSSIFDDFLSLIELLCLIPSVVISVGCVVNYIYFKQNNAVFVLVGKKVLMWLLAGALVVGSVIRRRQWRRVSGFSSRAKPRFENVSVLERIEKLEESMRSASSIIRMLSRQIEKLGIRFKVTRKSMKHPISETAALAQKNSETTRALALREEILEKELSEVQNVLLAMQEQQQKQLELILAIAKSGKLLENKRTPSQVTGINKTVSNSPNKVDGQPIQSASARKEATNNNAAGA
ncbi:hypothetical protein RND81_13G201900 [Saponaria officinalis]|uniref:Transmembrane protein n=1 Tax=Saponaria officinalis TaxID=3572 RepID=A0AAW1H227_SAPOF